MAIELVEGHPMKGAAVSAAHLRGAGPGSLGLDYNPHKVMEQIVVEYEKDGITEKCRTKLTQEKLLAMARHKEHVIVTKVRDGDNGTKYEYTQIGGPPPDSYADIQAVGPPPPLVERLQEAANQEPAAEPTVRLAAPTTTMRPVFERAVPAGPHEYLERICTPRPQLTVQIHGPFGKFTIGCQEAFVYDLYLILVHALNNGGLYEPPNDPQIEQTLMFEGEMHTGRCMAHYKMPDGKTAHSVYLLSE